MTAPPMIRTLMMTLLLVAASASGRDAMSDADKVFSNPQTMALAQAAAGGDVARLRTLATQGAHLDATGDHDVTLLQWALLRQDLTAMKALLDAGADPSLPGLGGDTVLHLAAKANDPRYLALLLDHGADPNAPHGITHAPPLDAALMNPQNDNFELLLVHHADPNRSDRMGNTPLHVAAQVHKSHCVLALLKAGADPTRRNQHGDTFQVYFNILPAGGLNPEAKATHDAVHRWLQEHHVALERAT
ncbi:ankyrin repeat domain-containing protein [Dyella sp.]|uniref:ankyrin repeat domain-containing protein n=1 Tax=Dyella sp. TaxID=1869338 RepID=UPI002ED04688